MDRLLRGLSSAVMIDRKTQSIVILQSYGLIVEFKARRYCRSTYNTA